MQGKAEGRGRNRKPCRLVQTDSELREWKLREWKDLRLNVLVRRRGPVSLESQVILLVEAGRPVWVLSMCGEGYWQEGWPEEKGMERKEDTERAFCAHVLYSEIVRPCGKELKELM